MSASATSWCTREGDSPAAAACLRIEIPSARAETSAHVRFRSACSTGWTAAPGASWASGWGYAIAAAAGTGAPVVAIEGDSAFGFSGMDLETVCRYRLPVTVIVLNNGGVYRGGEASAAPPDLAPTRLDPSAHHDRLIEAFGGTGYRATTPKSRPPP
jgi:thiamine pyrophosphate-dependent acetolactate synthase large subunit-like protein